ncbi:MAG: mechanosensitive ion channel family protein [Prosthecobacter sp.]|uniref:mechanosensitive ion channel family protein n=1 Tax=Prosthecobacter sp. TaxID=1965333 RepID=UPI0025EF011E|nr:mechanosensitive ion channel domain-containing protein [Prosthecobacter sp.]MCF7786687.1 mechanosensitive ion channel family protein [Prosthecobacter sp.]
MMLRAYFFAFLVWGQTFALISAEVEQVPAAIPGESSLLRKDHLNESGEKLGSIIDDIGASLATTPMAWMNEPAWRGIIWLKVLTSGLLLLVLIIGAPWLQRAIARRLQTPGEGRPPSAFQVLLDAARHPLYLFIWICGIYWALTPLFPHFANSNGSNRAQSLAGHATDAAALIALTWFAVRLVRLVNTRLRVWAAKDGRHSAAILAAILRKGVRLVFPVVALLMVLPLLNLDPDMLLVFNRITSLFLIGSMSWLIIQGLDAFERVLLSRHQLDTPDNHEARRIFTQANLLKKVIVAVVLILTAGSMLMVFDSVRQYGSSILASAGIAGLIIGVAAQRSIAGLLAGFQIAIAQPISIEDVVVVEGEWGRIEEITLTYVVVRIWDQRRLVLPINYFIEKPFQNWTRQTAEVLGTVFLQVDYSAPVGQLRDELTRIVKASSHWDGRVVGLQVTDSKDSTLELRALASAADGSKAWDLRCEIREKLVEYIRTNHPESLPRIRTGLDDRISALKHTAGIAEPS